MIRRRIMWHTPTWRNWARSRSTQLLRRSRARTWEALLLTFKVRPSEAHLYSAFYARLCKVPGPRLSTTIAHIDRQHFGHEDKRYDFLYAAATRLVQQRREERQANELAKLFTQPGTQQGVALASVADQRTLPCFKIRDGATCEAGDQCPYKQPRRPSRERARAAARAKARGRTKASAFAASSTMGVASAARHARFCMRRPRWLPRRRRPLIRRPLRRPRNLDYVANEGSQVNGQGGFVRHFEALLPSREEDPEVTPLPASSMQRWPVRRSDVRARCFGLLTPARETTCRLRVRPTPAPWAR